MKLVTMTSAFTKAFGFEKAIDLLEVVFCGDYLY